MADFQPFLYPVPVGGINALDPIDAMDPRYALSLVNLIPSGLNCKLRGGHSLFATTTAASVGTLTGISKADGNSDVITASGTTIYKCSLGSATGVGFGLSNSIFNCESFAYRVYMANGADDLQVYDSATGTLAASTFTGPTLANLINVSSYKERLYFVEKNSLKFWYGNTQAVGASALTAYDLQFTFKDGGYLVFAGSHVNQSSQKMQDLFMAVSSQGEVLFYEGSSPADTTTPWGLVARYKIGKPLGYRAFIKVFDDTIIITDQGLLSVASLFSTEPSYSLDSIGSKINPIVRDAAKNWGFSHLWHGAFYPSANMVLITVPLTGSTNQLLVYSILTRAWTIFEYPSNNRTMMIAQVAGNLYSGSSDGYLYKLEDTLNDNGSAISFSARTAFSFCGNRGLYKAFKDIRPLMKTSRSLNLEVGLDLDFRALSQYGTIPISPGTFTAWGSPWGSSWSSGVDYIYDRHTITGQGHNAAIRLRGSISNAPLEFNGFEIRFIQGSQV